jgi:CheY-like chemotaxis protein
MLMPDVNEPVGRVILLAEDELLVQRVAARVLSQAGYFLLCGDHGLHALELSRQFSGPIHLLLTDIQMPHLNGLELIGHIREERPETRILAMSGNALDPGMVSDIPLLRKPFTPAMLKRCIDEVFSG